MPFIDKIGKKARSIFYIIFISGLLSLTSIVLELVWNITLSRKFHLSGISFLESVGIVSFVYIIYFGIKFGNASWQSDRVKANSTEQNIGADKMSDFVNSNSLNPDILSKLPEEDKRELREFVSKCCGMHVQNSGQSSFRRRIEHIEG